MPAYDRFLLALTCIVLAPTAEANWLHYRGPTQNGLVAEPLAANLSSPPRTLWTLNVGVGTAAVTVKGDHAFTAGNFEKAKDLVQCIDAKSGKPVWKFEYSAPLDPNLFEGGPRATPTIDGNVVYAVSNQGDLYALEAGSGKKLWTRNYKQDFAGRRPEWGWAGSPTVEGNLLLLDVGGEGSSTVALNKTNGEVVWKSGNDKAGYGSPVVADFHGQRTVAVFKAEHLVGLSARDGKELWRTPWKTSYDINAATPLVIGNQILITSGYGSGAALIEISPSGATEKWRNKSLRAHVNTPVVHQGHIYGIDGNTGGGNLVCLEGASGAVKWTEKSMKGGSLILASGKLICFTEKGELVVCAASPSGFKAELRAPILGKRSWVQPTLSGGRLFLKNNDGDLACLAFGGK